MAPEKVTIAEKWLEVIDRPTGVKGTGSGVSIDRNAVRRMKTSAVYALQEASPRGTDIYVFADGTCSRHRTIACISADRHYR
jgi:hypothetical protein